MSTPEFILTLREKIGQEPLWLMGVTAVVLRDQQVLLVQRADNEIWSPVTGIIDPSEEPADAAAREVLEETDIVAVPEQLVKVQATAPMVHANGDQAQYLDFVSGSAGSVASPTRPMERICLPSGLTLMTYPKCQITYEPGLMRRSRTHLPPNSSSKVNRSSTKREA